MKKIKNKNILIATIAILIVIVGVIYMLPKLSSNSNEPSAEPNSKSKFVIKESETKTIKYTEFNNGLIKMKVPEGWKVDTIGDYIHYTVKAYDPEKPSYQFFFNLKTEGYNKSEDAKAFQQRYYPNSMFAKTSVIATKDTEGFYKIFNDLGTLNNTSTFTFPTLNDFT